MVPVITPKLKESDIKITDERFKTLADAARFFLNKLAKASIGRQAPEVDGEDVEGRRLRLSARRSGHGTGFADQFQQSAHAWVVETGKVLPFCPDPVQVELVRVCGDEVFDVDLVLGAKCEEFEKD